MLSCSHRGCNIDLINTDLINTDLINVPALCLEGMNPKVKIAEVPQRAQVHSNLIKSIL